SRAYSHDEVNTSFFVVHLLCRSFSPQDVALFLQEFNAPDIFMGVFAKSKCPRLTEICVGILGNMACFQDICMVCVYFIHISDLASDLLHGQFLPRLLLTCLSQPEVANIWVERIRDSPSVYDCVCFIMSSSTNGKLPLRMNVLPAAPEWAAPEGRNRAHCPDREPSARYEGGTRRSLGFWRFFVLLVAFNPPPPFQLISPEKSEPSGNPEGIQTELDEEMENDICKVWDMSMDEVGVGRCAHTSVMLPLPLVLSI
uniref:Protein SAAL1 n=1 Tax=Meleagris gallopavo TaxID=9103 RepID=A0A803Y4N8_MELGA